METPPIKSGALFTVLKHVTMMRGTPEDETRDTVLVEPGQVLLVTGVTFAAKNPHKKWWYVRAMHLNAVYWRLMTTETIDRTFMKIELESDLLDRMLDEDDAREHWDEFTY